MMAIDDRRGPTNTDPAARAPPGTVISPCPSPKGRKITITNEGKQPSTHWFEVNCKIFKRPPANVGYFHAQYRQGTPPPAGPYLILDAKGRGHLMGCVLSVKNNDGGWWGEGDEIVEIDGKPGHPGHRFRGLFLRVVRAARRLLPVLRGNGADNPSFPRPIAGTCPIRCPFRSRSAS